MLTDPLISNEELIAGVHAQLGAGVRAVRVHKRKKFRPTAGATGSYFERVQLAIDGRKTPAVLKLGRIPGGPPTREALFFAQHRAGVPLRTAACYGVGPASADADTWVLMERLPRGKRLVDWTLDETSEALRNLASLHARFLGDPPVGLPRPFTTDLESTLSHLPPGVRGVRDIFAAFPRFPRFVDDATLELALALCENAAIFRDAFVRSPQTLLHGDYHRGNLIARDGELQVAFDWQFVCAGPPAYDLAVFWSYLGIVTKPGFLRFFDRIEVLERSLTWEQVTETYGEALRALRPDADIDAILGCADEARAWEPLRQLTYMAAGMTQTFERELNFIYRDHPKIGGPIARWVGIGHLWRMYAQLFAELADTARRLLARAP